MNKDYIRLNLTKYERECVVSFYTQIIKGSSKQSVLNQAKMNLHGLARRLGLDTNELKILWSRIMHTYLTLSKSLTIYRKDLNKAEAVFNRIYPTLPVSQTLQPVLNTIEARKKQAVLDKQINNDDNIFFISTVHSEPLATGHKDYQGKVYVKENWKESVKDETLSKKIASYIRNHQIHTVEWVTGDEGQVWLTLRPNCKHILVPIPTEEVLSSSARSILCRHGLINPVLPGQKRKIDVKRYKKQNELYTKSLIKKVKKDN